MASVLGVEKAAERGTIGKFLDDMTSMYAINYRISTHSSDIGKSSFQGSRGKASRSSHRAYKHLHSYNRLATRCDPFM